MRKSEALIQRVKRLKELSDGMPPDIQFKIVDRVLGDNNILDEENSLVNLFGAIEMEMIIAQTESISF